MDIILKEEHEEDYVGFGLQNHLPLGQRTDLKVLVDLAYMSGNNALLTYFETVPTVEELRAEKEADFLNNTAKYVEQQVDLPNARKS